MQEARIRISDSPELAVSGISLDEAMILFNMALKYSELERYLTKEEWQKVHLRKAIVDKEFCENTVRELKDAAELMLKRVRKSSKRKVKSPGD